jgi:hypothetical protein
MVEGNEAFEFALHVDDVLTVDDFDIREMFSCASGNEASILSACVLPADCGEFTFHTCLDASPWNGMPAAAS